MERTASISFDVSIGLETRTVTAEFNTAPVISSVNVAPTQLNIDEDPAAFVVTIDASDQEMAGRAQQIQYELQLESGIRRQVEDAQQCLLLQITVQTDNPHVFDIVPEWGECPSTEDADALEYVLFDSSGTNVIKFGIEVTELAEPTVQQLFVPLSTRAVLNVPVIEQGVITPEGS